MILIVVEHRAGTPRKSAFELVSAGRALAAATGEPVEALVFGADPAAVAQTLAGYVDSVHVVAAAELEPFRAESARSVVSAAARALSAGTVLVPASRAGLSYGPRVALRLGAGYLEDVSELVRHDDALTGTRTTFLARVATTVRSASTTVVASVKLGAYPVAESSAAAGPIAALELAVDAADLRLEPLAREAAVRGRVPLDEADVVVCGGRGFGSAEAFDAHVVALADRLGAGVGATRAVVDAGWRAYGEQIGQTGKSVSPALYLALAVSGAVQHLSGMNRSGVIVAVNKDADAPIFRIADYGIVGDVLEVVPALQEALSEQG